MASKGITRVNVFDLCKAIAPKFLFDPLLVFAVCEQETEKDKKNPELYRPDVARLEQNYYRRYILPEELATTTEVLFSASYGIMQMMGQSLRERGFFQWHFEAQGDDYQKFFIGPLMNTAVVKAIDEYCARPEWNIEWGCKHLGVKRKAAGGDTRKMLSYWNGDQTGKYATEVLDRIPALKKEFGL